MAVSAYTDAQLNNNIGRNVKQYSDLDLFFSKKILEQLKEYFIPVIYPRMKLI